MCVFKSISERLRRFSADIKGEIPLDFLALTASVALLGATYFETQAKDQKLDQAEYREEIYVRKCGGMRAPVTDKSIVSQTSALDCN